MELTVLIALLVGLLSLWVLKRFLLPSKRLPPGPRPLPILGNLLLLKKSSSVHDLANELRSTYGPIFTLWMGSTPAIFVSGPEVLHEAMIKQGHAFKARKHFLSQAIINQNFRGLTTGVGERHRFFRKMLVSDILATNRLAKFRPIRDREVDIFVESLKEKARENGGLVNDFRVMTRLTVSNLLIGICFGRRQTLEDFLDMDDVMTQRFKMSVGTPRDFIPFLQWFPDKKGVKRQQDLKKRADDYFNPLIEERRRALLSGHLSGKGTFVDSLLALQGQSVKSGEETIDILDGDIVLLCLEILNAGTDSTSLNLEYSLANLINHPEMQEKLFGEISTLVGDRVVTEDDIPNLPYLQAVLKESLRRNSPARLSPNRVAETSAKVAGYDIPANALVMQHLEAVAMDPNIWEEPLEFKPERFLNRKKPVDFTGSSEVTLIPFGAGRRICPAINLAFLHGHLLLARLIQAFEWKSATPGKLLDLTPDTGLSAPMKYPLTPVLRDRKCT